MAVFWSKAWIPRKSSLSASGGVVQRCQVAPLSAVRRTVPSVPLAPCDSVAYGVNASEACRGVGVLDLELGLGCDCDGESCCKGDRTHWGKDSRRRQRALIVAL
jgi:hypothetical protein